METKKVKFKLWQIVILVLITPIVIGALIPEKYVSDSNNESTGDIPKYEVSSKEDVSYAGCIRYNYFIKVPSIYSKEDVLSILNDMGKKSSGSEIISVFVDYEGNQVENRLNIGYGIGTNGNCGALIRYSSEFIKGTLK